MAAQQLTHAVHSGETTAAFANHAAVKLSGSIGTSNDNVHDLAKAAVPICFKQAFPACCCEQDYLTRLPGRRTIPYLGLCSVHQLHCKLLVKACSSNQIIQQPVQCTRVHLIGL